MVLRLAARASGLRHLRWSRELLASLDAHAEHDAHLAPALRSAVLEEAAALRERVAALSGAVKAYRDFLERRRVLLRGLLRLGRYLEASATGDDARAEATLIREGFEEAFAGLEVRERAPLRAAVGLEKGALRERVAELTARLEGMAGAAFAASLFPEVSADGSYVIDDDDDDDDATAGA